MNSFSINKYLEPCCKCGRIVARPRRGHFKCVTCRDKKKYPNEFLAISKKIRLRDKKCKCCGDTKHLVVHHLDLDPKNNHLNNLITLCTQCHLSLHNKYSPHKLKNSKIRDLFPKNKIWGSFGKRLLYKDRVSIITVSATKLQSIQGYKKLSDVNHSFYRRLAVAC